MSASTGATGTVAWDVAGLTSGATWADMTPAVVEATKIRVADALGCAFAAVDEDVPDRVARVAVDLGDGAGACTLVGREHRGAPDRAALVNGALVRYLDYNDSYLAPGETCHPSDEIAPVLAAAEYADASGRQLLLAVAVAYQVACRLADAAPVRGHGFDHTTHGAYATAAGVAKALDLDRAATTHAIAIAGTALNALRVTRTGSLSHWKGLAAPFAASAATLATFFAAAGVTGPAEVFEGVGGFADAITGPIGLDWGRERIDRVPRTILKRYNAEVHGQAAIEALLDLRTEHSFAGADVDRIDVDIFQVAYDIIGGGAEGAKTAVTTKEQADHSLPYLLAVAALDGQVEPAQYAPDRIGATDVRHLLQRVHVRPADDLSRRFPEQHACRLRVTLSDGRVLDAAKRDYLGFHTRPMRWPDVTEKTRRLTAATVDGERWSRILDTIRHLDQVSVRHLTGQLGSAVGG